jgi:hypothetical protein
MTDLQNALDRHPQINYDSSMVPIFKAARLVANPNIKAATEVGNRMYLEISSHRFGMGEGMAERIVAAALTPPGDTQDD